LIRRSDRRMTRGSCSAASERFLIRFWHGRMARSPGSLPNSRAIDRCRRLGVRALRYENSLRGSVRAMTYRIPCRYPPRQDSSVALDCASSERNLHWGIYISFGPILTESLHAGCCRRRIECRVIRADHSSTMRPAPESRPSSASG